MGLKVIGAGGPRTGTASLKVALEELGFGNCYHMEYLFNNPDEVKYWIELFETGTTDFEKMFDGFQSTVDFPGYMNYKIFMDKYPDAKVILNDRDPEEWYESALNTAYSVTPKTIPEKLKILTKMIGSARFRKIAQAFRLVEKYLWNQQYQGNFKNREKTLDIYRTHNEEIKSYVPKEKLLIYNVKQGWEPLCEFLDVPVPNKPFPKKNQRKEFNEQFVKLMNSGGELKLK